MKGNRKEYWHNQKEYEGTILKMNRTGLRPPTESPFRRRAHSNNFVKPGEPLSHDLSN